MELYNATGCFKKFQEKHPTKQHLYGHLHLISQIIQDEPHMRDTAGEARMTSKAMFFHDDCTNCDWCF